jgi:two-component system NtrC family sensor kinase
MTLPKLWNQVRQWIQRPPFPLDPNRSHLPWTISTGVLLALLTLLGLLGNYWSWSLFLGVDFLFGSIFSLLIGYLYGVVPGTLAALIASSYTYVLWSHPYAIVIFTAETAFVTWQLRRRRLNIVTLDGVYWLVLGLPLVWLFYSQLLQVPTESVVLIMLKQAVNGLFNGLVATGIIALTPLRRWLAPRQNLVPQLSFQQTIATLLLAFIFLPMLTLTVFSSRAALQAIDTEVPANLQSASTGLLQDFQIWQTRQANKLGAIAAIARQANPQAELQQSIQLLAQVSPSEDRIYFLNGDNTLRAAAPAPPERIPNRATLDSLGDRPSGLTLLPSSQAGAPNLILQWRPVADDGSGGQGYVVSEVSQDFLAQLITLENQSGIAAIHATLLDDQQQVLQSTSPDLPPLSAFDHPQDANTRPLSDVAYHWLPAGDMPLFNRWQQSFYVQTTTVANAPWTLVVETAAEPYFTELRWFYIQRLGVILVLVMVAIPVAYWLSRYLVKPMERLATVTTNLPHKLLEQEPINWPQTQVLEMATLVENCQTMAHSLEQQFQTITAAKDTLEKRIAERTQELATINQNLRAEVQERQRVADALHQSELEAREKAIALENTLSELQRAQTQLVQAEKMSSLGQLVAGVAHEINNPVNFIHGNLTHVETYSRDLLTLTHEIQQRYGDTDPKLQTLAEEMDLAFLQADLPKMLKSMQVGTERIRQIVLSLRNFSRTDEAAFKAVDIHEGLDSTLLILQYRLKARPDRPAITVHPDYGDLPPVSCYPSQLNQVFMNLLANAIDALEAVLSKESGAPAQITIRTRCVGTDQVAITIADNGPGIPDRIKHRLFEPFFTTKPIGKGTGMGLSISYQIITEQHHGTLTCDATPGQGTAFTIHLPIQQGAQTHPLAAVQ